MSTPPLLYKFTSNSCDGSNDLVKKTTNLSLKDKEFSLQDFQNFSKNVEELNDVIQEICQECKVIIPSTAGDKKVDESDNSLQLELEIIVSLLFKFEKAFKNLGYDKLPSIKGLETFEQDQELKGLREMVRNAVFFLVYHEKLHPDDERIINFINYMKENCSMYKDDPLQLKENLICNATFDP